MYIQGGNQIPNQKLNQNSLKLFLVFQQIIFKAFHIIYKPYGICTCNLFLYLLL
jgi:hypothetical protein